MTHGSGFVEIAIILSIATILGIFGQTLKQPLLIMFMVTGILVGPSGFSIIKSYDQIEALAHIGIALLLFIVGLKLDLKLIRTTGPVALATGLGQIVFTSAIGFLIAMTMGMSLIHAAYVSVALTFSSTIIIIKLLSDKKEIDSLHGQIAIGFLIIQDIAAILALVALTTFGSPSGEGSSVFMDSLIIIVKGLGLLGIIGLLMRYVLPKVTRRLAYSQEMLTLFAIAWAVFFGVASELLGFSKEVGAFLAGISLASTEYRDAIGARLTTLRDFLLLFFFIDLGARLDWSTLGARMGDAAWLSLFVLVGNPLIVMTIMGFMGYRRRTGFLAGLTVAQISEFSLIVAALGLSIGHITDDIMGLITLVGVITICTSTYMIIYSAQLYRFLADYLKIFERKIPFREAGIDSSDGEQRVDVIMVGLGNYGNAIADYLIRRNKTITAVDFDPMALDIWRKKGVSVLYGDIADPELHEHLPLHKVRWVVCAVRSYELNINLFNLLKAREYLGKIALTATNQDEADDFEKIGTHVVLRPYLDAAEQAADILTHAIDFLPDNVDWPIAFREIRIRPEVSVAGKSIKDIPLRSITGVSILAVIRAGRVYYDPGPDFEVYPGDRLVAIGHPEELLKAETIINQFDTGSEIESTDRFEIAEINVANESKISGKSIADLKFRQTHGVTVIGIQRENSRIMTPSPKEILSSNDCLVVIGTSKAIKVLKKIEPL